MATQNVNGRLTALENVTDIGTKPPGYIHARDYAELDAKLAEMPPGWRGKVYMGAFSPDDWDDPPDEI